MSPASPCGLFGKLPQQADFVSRHLPGAFTDRWLGWLQAALSVSREQLGEDWLDCYLTSPIWRFALGPGVCLDSSVTGVLIPSVDEVGRYFPLTVAHPGEHDVWLAHEAGEAWYRAAEAVALAALEAEVGFAELMGRLDALPPPCFPRPPSQAVAGGRRGLVVSRDEDADLLWTLLAAAADRHLRHYGLWWTEGSARVPPCAVLCAGLPEAGWFAAFLDGDWRRCDWDQAQWRQSMEPA